MSKVADKIIETVGIAQEVANDLKDEMDKAFEGGSFEELDLALCQSIVRLSQMRTALKELVG
jgi:hypothetical protein